MNVKTGRLNFFTRGATATANAYSTLTVKGNYYVGSVQGATAATSQIGGVSGWENGVNSGFAVNPLNSASIGGNLYVGGGSTASLNVGWSAYGSSYDISSPDMSISGVVVGYNGVDNKGEIYSISSSSSSTLSALFLRTITDSTITSLGSSGVISVGGISGKIAVRNQAAPKSVGKVLSVLVLNNAAGKIYTSNDLLTDDQASLDDGTMNGATGFNTNSKVKIVMNGEGTQTFTGRAGFSGGVTMNKGTLLFNFTNDKANGYNNIAASTDKDGNPVSASTQLFTHGDLEMNGGTFGSYYVTKAGSWSFNNIYWKSGTIQLCVYENAVDVITLDKIGEEGGALAKGSGVVENMNFVFEGADSNSYLIDDARKIISWSSYDSTITYTAEAINLYGQEYNAVFNAKTDGLYVQYVAVPEASTAALIFGLFAIGFVAYRRRQK